MGRKPKKASKVAKVSEKVDSDISGLVGEIVNDLPEGTSPEVIQKITQAISYSGPIPPSSEFARYEEVLPGAADRIMSLAENEQAIRKSENNYLLLSERIKVLGSIIVSLCLIGAGVYCGIIGQPWLGVALGTSGAVAGIMSGLIKRI